MKRLIAASAAFGALALFSVITQAQTYPSPGPSSSPSSSPSPSGAAQPSALALLNDVAALNYLHHVNNLELTEASSASGLVQGSQAMALVQALQTDHQSNEQQVQQLATQKGVVLYSFQPATYELAADSQLSTLAGTAQYDQAFGSLELQDHQAVLQQLQSYLKNVTDSDIKNLINQTIPIVQKHIQLAQAAMSSTPQPSSSPSVSPSPSPSVSPSSSPSPSPSASP